MVHTTLTTTVSSMMIRRRETRERGSKDRVTVDFFTVRNIFVGFSGNFEEVLTPHETTITNHKTNTLCSRAAAMSAI